MKPYQEIRPSVYQLLLAIFLPSTGPQIEDGFPLFSDHACFGRQKCPTERFQDYGILRRDHPQQVWLVSGQRIGLWDPLDTIRLEGTVVKWSKPLWFAKECESTHWLREFPWFRVESQSPNRKSDMLGRFPGKFLGFLGQLSITNSRMDVNCYVGLPKFTKKTPVESWVAEPGIVEGATWATGLDSAWQLRCFVVRLKMLAQIGDGHFSGSKY